MSSQHCQCLIPGSCKTPFIPTFLQTKITDKTTWISNLFGDIERPNQTEPKTLDRKLAAKNAIDFHSETRSFVIDEKILKNLSESPPDHFVLTLPDGTQAGLVKTKFLSTDFHVTTSSGTHNLVDEGIYYQGSLLDEKQNSIVSISIFAKSQQIIGSISSDTKGNVSFGPKLTDPKGFSETKTNRHIFYIENAPSIVSHQTEEGPGKWNCHTPPGVTIKGYTETELKGPDLHAFAVAASSKVIQIYVETDYDLYTTLGSVQAVTNYVNSIFNNATRIWNNEGIPVQMSGLYIWDTPSPYSGNTSSTLLSQFVSNRKSFNGDFGILLAFRGNAGLANSLNGWCTRNRTDRSLSQCFAGINTFNAPYPAYSWATDAFVHELGHLENLRHSHYCGYNGNNTAIDGCAGYVEGTCPLPPIPDSKYTFIMSYCHLQPVGKNLANGFGIQHGNLLRNYFLQNASCLQDSNQAPPAIPVIGFTPSYLYFTVQQNTASPTQTINIINANLIGDALTWTATTEVPWITLSATTDTTPSSLQVGINPVGVAPGSYKYRVWFTAPNAILQTLVLFITINPINTSPTITLTPTSLIIKGTVGFSIANQTLALSNTGGGTLNYTITDSASWLTVSPLNGNIASNNTQSLIVNVNASGLAAGTYTANITVSATGAMNTPQTVPVTLVLTNPQSTIQLSSNSLKFTGDVNTSIPNQSLTLTNSGAGSMNFTVTDNASWLTISPTSGTLASNSSIPLTISINNSTLTVGSYSATITVTDPNATNTPQTVQVSLIITSTSTSPVISINPSKLTFTGPVATNIPSQNFVLQNIGGGILSYNLSTNVPWLSLSPASGNLNSGVATTISVNITNTNMTTGTYNAIINIISQSASNSPQTVSVTLNLTPPSCAGGTLYNTTINYSGAIIYLPTYRTQSAGITSVKFMSPIDPTGKFTLNLNKYNSTTTSWQVVATGPSINYQGEAGDYYIAIQSIGGTGGVSVCYITPTRVASSVQLPKTTKEEGIETLQDALQTKTIVDYIIALDVALAKQFPTDRDITLARLELLKQVTKKII